MKTNMTLRQVLPQIWKAGLEDEILDLKLDGISNAELYVKMYKAAQELISYIPDVSCTSIRNTVKEQIRSFQFETSLTCQE